MHDKISDFAQLIAHFRHERGLSQGQLAQATRLSRTYVYHLESGLRTNPSSQVVNNIVRALELAPTERDQLYDAYTTLTGHFIEYEQSESGLLDLGELASLLVSNTFYPAHALDKLWYLYAWNDAAITLFELEEEMEDYNKRHLLMQVFDPSFRKRLHGWENLAHRLVRDFFYNTRTITHLPEYKILLKSLRDLPEFRRIASVTYPQGRPEASFVFQIQNSQLGRLTLRTATTVFSGSSGYSMVSYVPGDQQTLTIYRQRGWQPE